MSSHRVVSVNNEVRCINIVSFKNHFKHLWLMNSTLLHELDNFVLMCDGLINVVINLNLGLVLQLTALCEELFILWWVSEVLAIFGKEVEFADVSPGVPFISHWIHGPNSDVLTSSK